MSDKTKTGDATADKLLPIAKRLSDLGMAPRGEYDFDLLRDELYDLGGKVDELAYDLGGEISNYAGDERFSTLSDAVSDFLRGVIDRGALLQALADTDVETRSLAAHVTELTYAVRG